MLLLCAFAVLITSLPFSAVAQDLVFTKTKFVITHGEMTKQVPAIVTWGEDKVQIEIKSKISKKKYGEYERTIPYDKMSDLTYEYSKHWRVVGAILLTPWVLFSKRKHHWFSFTYEKENGKKDAIVLRIDKKEELTYRRRVPPLTGLELTEHIEK